MWSMLAVCNRENEDSLSFASADVTDMLHELSAAYLSRTANDNLSARATSTVSSHEDESALFATDLQGGEYANDAVSAVGELTSDSPDSSISSLPVRERLLFTRESLDSAFAVGAKMESEAIFMKLMDSNEDLNDPVMV